MLEKRQLVILTGAGIVFWCVDLAGIRLLPALVVDPLEGALAYPASIPVAWICMRLCQRLARLDRSQLVPGVSLMVMVAALLHALALRWAATGYGSEEAGRLGSAWLLWVYGLILGCALLAAWRADPIRQFRPT